MTDKQLKQAQDLKRTIAALEKELENFANAKKGCLLTVNLPDCGNLIEDVRKVFVEYLNEFNEVFRKL